MTGEAYQNVALFSARNAGLDSTSAYQMAVRCVARVLYMHTTIEEHVVQQKIDYLQEWKKTYFYNSEQGCLLSGHTPQDSDPAVGEGCLLKVPF